MLDERQQFKAAFIARCIENGVTEPDDILEVVKEAREKVAFGFGTAALVNAAKGLGALGLGTLAVAPPAIGFLAGNTLGSAGDLNDIDAEEVKRKELIEELRKQTERLRRKQQPQLR